MVSPFLFVLVPYRTVARNARLTQKGTRGRRNVALCSIASLEREVFLIIIIYSRCSFSFAEIYPYHHRIDHQPYLFVRDAFCRTHKNVPVTRYELRCTDGLFVFAQRLLSARRQNGQALARVWIGHLRRSQRPLLSRYTAGLSITDCGSRTELSHQNVQ